MANKKFELFTEEAGSKVIILVIAILAVIFIAGLILQRVWTTPTNSENKEDLSQNVDNNNGSNASKNLKFGKYSTVSNGEELILKEYFSDIFMTLSSGSQDEVYSITSKDYINRKNYDVNSLYNFLKSKGIVGKAFECTKYSVAVNPRFGRVFSLEIASADSKIIDRLIIIESSPRHYTISFDGYVGKKSQDIELTRDGLKLRIVNVEEYKDIAYFTIELTNVSSDTLVINNQNRASEPVRVKLSNDKNIYNSSDWFMANSKILKPGQSVRSTVMFSIIDLQASKIKSMTIVDVYNETTKATSDYEYQIY